MNGTQLSQQYKNHLSDYSTWEQASHAEDWILYPDNLADHICIDEVALSKGELYTVVTNAGACCQKGSLVAMVKGTLSDTVIEILKKIPLSNRKTVRYVTVDLANNMERIGRIAFPQAALVSDRFHVQQLVSEALQQMRIKHRWEAIKQENQAIKKAKENKEKYTPELLENGDTKKQLLARSRYLLFKPTSKWTDSQKQRAQILFKQYPDIHKAYLLSMMFRNIYQTAKNPDNALKRINQWKQKIERYQYDLFITAAHSIEAHMDTILAFFKERKTNALAESFNSKLKAFRAIFRGVRDIPFFLYRVSMIFG